MNTIPSIDGHLFYKPRQKLEVGDELPNIVLNVDSGRSMYDELKTHMILVTLCESCSICSQTLDALDELIFQRQVDWNFVILFEGDPNKAALIQKVFQGRVNVYPLDEQQFNHELGMHSFPRAYTINKNGQVLMSEVCHSIEQLERMYWPYDIDSPENALGDEHS